MKRAIIQEKRYAYAPNAHNFIHILLHEVIDMEQLKKAIMILHRANPILNSILVQDETGFAYEELPFMMPEIFELERLNEKYYKKVLSEEERIPLNLHQNSSYRLIILKDEEYTDLILMTHQLLLDATSSLDLLKTILEVYTTGKVHTFISKPLPPHQLKLSYIDQLMLTKVRNSYKNIDEGYFSNEAYRKFYMNYYHNFKTKMIHFKFNDEETKKIKAYCKLYQINLYTLLFTALKSAEDRIRPNQLSSYKHSVIMKNLRNVQDSFGNYATLGYLDFRYNYKKSIVENCKNLEAKIKATDFYSYYYLNSEFPIEAFRCLENKDDISFSLAHFATRLGYWDKMAGSELSFCDHVELPQELQPIQVEILRSCHQLVEKNMSIIEYNGHLSFNLQFNSRSTNYKDMKDMVQHMHWVLTEGIRE